MRLSSDQLNAAGDVVNGFDYDLQVWVIEGIVQPCGHSKAMRVNGLCCHVARVAGLTLAEAKRRLHVDSSKGKR